MEVTRYNRDVWRYDAEQGIIYREWKGHRYRLAKVTTFLPWHEQFASAEEEAEANGILMAHANRFYEACRAVVFEAENANANGDALIPSHVYELVVRAFERLKGGVSK